MSETRRYQARPIAAYWNEKILPQSMTVHAEGAEPINTGLVDHRGHPIYRMPEPVGFRFGGKETA